MRLKEICIAIYESSLLLKAGLPLTDAWDAIAKTHANQHEVAALFTNLANDWRTRTPSLKPFETCETITQDLPVVVYYAQLAAVTTVYDVHWRDMATALLLKEKLRREPPTPADVALGKYLVSLSKNATDIEKEFCTWSVSKEWQDITLRSGDETFPEEWLDAFQGTAADTLAFPPTTNDMLKSLIQAGTLDTLPKLLEDWTRYVGAADHIFKTQ
jgi:hypothetical protein